MPNKQKITDQNIGTFQTIYENYQVNPAFYENHEQSAELLNAVKLYEAHLASQQPPEIKEQPTPSRFLPDYLQPEPTQIDTYGVKPGTKAVNIRNMKPIEAGTIIDDSDGGFSVKERKMGELQKAVNSYVSGAWDLVDLFGGGLVMAGFEESGERIRNFAKDVKTDYRVPELEKTFEWSDMADPTFYYTKGVRMIPMLTTIIPTAIGGGAVGGGIATWLGASRGVISVTAAVSSALAARPIESGMEAIGTYNEMIDAGESKEKAGEAASSVFLQNLALIGMDAAQYALAFAKVPAPLRKGMAEWIKRSGIKAAGFAAASVSEGYEEVLQNYFQEFGKASARGELGVEELKALLLATPEAKEAFVLGSMAGVGFQAVGQVSRGNEIEGKLSESELDKLIEEQIIILEVNDGAEPADVKEKMIVDALNVGLEKSGLGITKPEEKIEEPTAAKTDIEAKPIPTEPTEKPKEAEPVKPIEPVVEKPKKEVKPEEKPPKVTLEQKQLYSEVKDKANREWQDKKAKYEDIKKAIGPKILAEVSSHDTTTDDTLIALMKTDFPQRYPYTETARKDIKYFRDKIKELDEVSTSMLAFELRYREVADANSVDVFNEVLEEYPELRGKTEKPAPIEPKEAVKPKEAPIVPKEAEKPAEAKLPAKKTIIEPTVKEDKQLFTEIYKDIEKQIEKQVNKVAEKAYESYLASTAPVFKEEVGKIKYKGENFTIENGIIKIKTPQGEYECSVPTSGVDLKGLKRDINAAFIKKGDKISVSGVSKRKPVLESLKVLQDKTAPPKRVEAAKAFLKEKGIGFSIAEVTHEVKKEESHIKVENSIKALSEKQKEISQIKDATTQEKAEVLKEYNQKAAETKKELTQLMSEDVKTKANLKKQAFVFNNLKSLVETTKESIEGQDISNKEKTEYNKALDGLLSILEDESGFILAGMIPKLSTFIKSKKDGTLTKKEVDLLNEKLKRDYTFGNEKFESEYQTDKTDDTHTLWGGLTNFFKDAWHKITREFEHLPKSKEFAEVAFILRMAQKQKGNASYKANKNISTIIDNLEHGDFNLFSRKVLLDDLVESVNRDEPLPRNWDADMVKEELSRLDIKIKDNEKVQEALNSRKEYWDLLKKDYIDAMKLVGKNIKGMDRESYFRHLVLDYADAENYLGIYNKLKAPGNQSFLKKRVGSIRPIRTDYIMAEYDVIVRMVHDISVANIINAIKSKTDIISEVQEKTPEGEEWRKNIPEGYSVWQPEQGNFFFFANTIPDNIATDLLEGYLEEAEITKDQIRKVLALGGRKQEMVLRNEVIETLNNLNPPKSKNWVSGTLRWVTRKWKIWTLISPRRYIRYNLRNMTGDAEAAFVGNPTSFKNVPQATKELWAAFTGKKTMTDQLQDYFEMGGFEATLQSQEIKPVDELKPLITVNKSIFKKVWNGYWKAAKSSTDFRESILRYSNYISYLEQLEAGTLKNYGASMKAEVDALSSNKMKAYMLANDLLGAYDRVGVAGQSFRELLYPFWSWQEVNFKRYVRFVQNAADSDQLAGAVGRKLGAKTVLTSLRVGKYAIKAMGLWTMLTLWNNLKFPDEEKELSEQEKNTPHIIFGRDKNGEIISFNRLGTLGDFVEWFGLDAAPNNVAAYLKNRKTIKEISIEMLQSPVNKFAQGINPLLKAPPEFMDRKSWFPDVFNRYTIRDRGVHLARSLGLENEYKAVTGKPSKKYAESLKNLAIYTTNPGQVAYSRNYTTKNKFLKKSKMTGYFMTDKGDAIYNYKAAIRYKDAKAAAKYYLDYYILMKIANPQLSDKKFENLVAKDMSKALVNMHPLSGLSKKTGVDLLYIAQLNFEEKIVLAKAIEYYEETLLRTADNKFAIEMNKEMVKLLK